MYALQYVPIDVVPEKEVVCVWWVTRLVKVSEEIVELAVDVTHDVDGCLQLQEHRLLQEHFPGHHAQLPDLVLRKTHLELRAWEGHIKYSVVPTDTLQSNPE